MKTPGDTQTHTKTLWKATLGSGELACFCSEFRMLLRSLKTHTFNALRNIGVTLHTSFNRGMLWKALRHRVRMLLRSMSRTHTNTLRSVEVSTPTMHQILRSCSGKLDLQNLGATDENFTLIMLCGTVLGSGKLAKF